MMDEIGLVDWIVRRSAGQLASGSVGARLKAGSPKDRGTRRHAGMPPHVKIGPGDDAAVLSSVGADELVFTIDEVVEGTHFRLTGKGLGPRATGRDVGYKALAASVSDLAAMGAEPLAAVAAASMRKGQAGGLGKAIHDGLSAAARDTGCPLVGGNVTETSGPVTLTVAATGRVPKGGAFLRSGARAGDVIFVTGELGGSALGKHLRPSARLAEARLCRKLGRIRAMMDVTDGLALDLWRMTRASGVGAEIDAARVPVSAAARRLARKTGRSALEHALSDGEDYELLFTVEARAADGFERSWRLRTRKAGSPDVPARLSRIGTIRPRREGLLIRDGGKARPLRPEGYRHL